MRKTGQPTINDVARIAGVSKKTVSRVINRSPLLNDDTRKRVEDVIGDLGYIPNPQARALELRRNFLIGLVHDNPNAQTVMNVQQGMLEALHDTEFEMVVRPVDRGSATMLEDLRHFLERQRLFGVLLMPPSPGKEREGNPIEELPVILMPCCVMVKWVDVAGGQARIRKPWRGRAGRVARVTAPKRSSKMRSSTSASSATSGSGSRQAVAPCNRASCSARRART